MTSLQAQEALRASTAEMQALRNKVRELETDKEVLRIEKESAERLSAIYKSSYTAEKEEVALLKAKVARSEATAAEELETAKEELRAEKERTQRHLDISFEEHRNAKNASLWPDPNSSVLSKIDFGVPLVELFKWLDVRDTLLGENERKQDIPAALALARGCKHPDAVWLTSIFEGKDVSTEENARKIFLSVENDPRALCFAWYLTDAREYDLTLLRLASGMGNAFACSTLCGQVLLVDKEEAFRLAHLAAAQCERDGFFWLGLCFRNGHGCAIDLSLAQQNILIDAELGHVCGAEASGFLLDHSDPARLLWLGRAALRGWPHSFLDYFSKQVELTLQVLRAEKEMAECVLEIRSEKERRQRFLEAKQENDARKQEEAARQKAKNEQLAETTRAYCFSSFSSTWPDPNSSILSKIDFGVPLAELFKWLVVRDALLWRNFRKQDITRALALARDCKHPDAVWLTSIFEGKDVSTKERARDVFLSVENDPRALCFAWCLTDFIERDDSLLRRAAEMGYAFACSTLSGEVSHQTKEEPFRLAEFAASEHERDGFSILDRCFRSGVGCEKDLILAKENLLLAAELGNVFAAETYGYFLVESNPARLLWLGRAASRGLTRSFFQSFPYEVKQFFSGSGNATKVFVIGRALKGNIDTEKKQIFGKKLSVDSSKDEIGLANQAVSFYDLQIRSARLAVDTWTVVATRLHMIKDVRIFIGMMIWGARFEANYKVENAPNPSESHDQKRSRK